jgi:hypothetical protein
MITAILNYLSVHTSNKKDTHQQFYKCILYIIIYNYILSSLSRHYIIVLMHVAITTAICYHCVLQGLHVGPIYVHIIYLYIGLLYSICFV